MRPPARARLRVGDEPLPKACDAHDVARAYGVSLNTVYDWHAGGKLRWCELPKPIGSRRWSGVLIDRSFEGPLALRAKAS